MHLLYVDATVRTVRRTHCPGIDDGLATPCQIVRASVTSGPTQGRTVTVTVIASDITPPTLHGGDRVVLTYNRTAQDEFRYTFRDFQRSIPLALLAVLFAVVVIVVGRIKGLRSLAALAISLAVLLVFVLPSLLRGHPGLAVALVGTTAVAFVAMYLSNGWHVHTTVALAGTLASLALTSILAVVFVWLTHLTGLIDESQQVIRVTAAGVNLPGLLVAGTVVGALGVLNDITITQVSAVAELRAANDQLGRAELYRRAIRIGRDHIAATINTLVLAYAGASLALLLTFAEGTIPFGRVLTSEVVATEIVSTLVGSIGLVVAVPITTALAAAVTGHHDSRPTPGLRQRRRMQKGEGPGHAGPAQWDDFAPVGDGLG